MLKDSPDLDFNRPVGHPNDHMNSTVAVTGRRAPIDKRRIRKELLYGRSGTVLSVDAFNDDATSCDVLNPAQARMLSNELLDDRSGSFCRTAAGLKAEGTANCMDNLCVRLRKRATVLVKRFQVLVSW